MIDINEMYKKKADFVKYIEAALVMDRHIEYMEYKAFPEKHEEFIRIGYPGGSESIICVTADSATAILKEICADVSGEYLPVGAIKLDKHKEMVRSWWDE